MKPPRLSIRYLMLALALLAIVLGVARQKMIVAERTRLALLRSDLARAEERAKWSRAMQKKGYVSPASAQADQARLSGIKQEMKEFKPLLVDPAK
ncbi:hypothetical protein TA3x_000422 [Tundrisphaera sp. TA3]|uniref:hypothetical protein n=1 Tax=Tundrisphaera sp. TA3 TaxID=3435775 RepID=UPI003EB90C9F